MPAAPLALRPSAPPAHAPEIRLAVDATSSYGRGVLMGVIAYARLHGPWTMHIESLASDAARFSGTIDGIIVQATRTSVVREARRTGAAIVNVSGVLPRCRLPSVVVDSTAAGRIAAAHLFERGLRSLGFMGFPAFGFSDERLRGVREFATEHALPLSVYHYAGNSDKARDVQARRAWVRSLPKPVGVIAANDIRARHAVHACAQEGMRVPEDVAVVGIDNDEIECEIAGMPISSVGVPAEKIGYDAALMLDRQMRGLPIEHCRRVAPGEVATRRSTDVLAIDDRDLSGALRFIRDHATRGISVDDVVEVANIARRTLEQRFRAATGRSVHEEIRRTQIARAKQLLRESDIPIASIATACGFSAAYYLSVTFRKQTGQTPRAYRKQFELG